MVGNLFYFIFYISLVGERLFFFSDKVGNRDGGWIRWLDYIIDVICLFIRVVVNFENIDERDFGGKF